MPIRPQSATLQVEYPFRLYYTLKQIYNSMCVSIDTSIYT